MRLHCLFAVLTLVAEAGPLINTRENPLSQGADLSVDYTFALSAAVPLLDANRIQQSIMVSDTADSLVSGAAKASPDAKGPGLVAEELVAEHEPEERAKPAGPLLAGALGLGAVAGFALWRVRRNNQFSHRVENAAAKTRRLWYLPGILGTREIWGKHTPFWDRVDRIFDWIEVTILRRRRLRTEPK